MVDNFLSVVLVSSGKYHRLYDLYNQDLFSHSLEAWKYKVKLPRDYISGEDVLPGL